MFKSKKSLIICILLWVLTFKGLHSTLAIEPLEVESYMAEKIINHTDQQRSVMIHNEVLLFAARKKAEDMAAREYFSHTDPDGFGMNFTIHMAGYKHRLSRSKSANNFESIGARHQNRISAKKAADIVFDAWLESPGHRTHVLGSQSFFSDQTNYAVGYAFDSKGPHGWSSHYFVFLSAPSFDGVPTQPLEANTKLTPVAEWLFETLTLSQMWDGDPDKDGVSNVMEYALETHPLSPTPAPPLGIRYHPDYRSIEFIYAFRENLGEGLVVQIDSTDWLNHPFWDHEMLFTLNEPFLIPIDQHATKKFFKLDLTRTVDGHIIGFP